MKAAQRHLLTRLSGSGTVLLAVHLDLPATPTWCDGRDSEGRAVFLVGRHQLGVTEEAQAAVAAVLKALAEGHVPEGVHVITYAPRASAFIAEVAAGQATEVLADGPRKSGKTMAVPAAFAILAECHARAGYRLPLRVQWLHDSLVNASVKSGRSLEAEMWAGLWTLRDDRRVVVLTVAGVEMVVGDLVGTQDTTAQERARAECHVLAAEELVPSLDESGGVSERIYELALTSARLDTRRRVAISTTNPGSEDTWPYRRFILGGGHAGCVRVQIPAEDRLTAEEIEQQCAAFRDSPDLEARLGRGEWVGLKLGELVAEGFDASVHVAPRLLTPSPDHALVVGWDGGHSPSAVIGQMIGGQIRIYASLNDLKVGVLELIEDQVRPWLAQWAPWTLDDPATLVHVLDPSMHTGSEATVTISAEKTIRKSLGGRVVPKGSNVWSPRRETVLRVLRPALEDGKVPLAINPTEDTKLLRQALATRWIYRSTPDGRVDRSGSKKPNSPWADVGDAFAYLVGWLLRGAAQGGPRAPYLARSWSDPLGRDRRPVLPSDMQHAKVIRTPNTWR